MKVKHTTPRIELMRMVVNGELSYTYETAGQYLWRRPMGSTFDEFLRGQDARILFMQRAELIEPYKVFIIHRGHLPIRATDAGRAWLAECDR